MATATPDEKPDASAEDTSAQSASTESASTESASTENASTESAPTENTVPDHTDSEAVAAETTAPGTPVSQSPASAAPAPAPATPDAAATPAVVYVTAPTPPRARGARGVGVLVALLGAGLFSAAYAAIVLVLGLLVPSFGLGGALRFTTTPTFWIPVIVFALAYILLVVIVNRAGWWAHVLGGFLVALVVWIGFVGAAIISAGAFGQPAPVVGAVVAEQLTNPLGFAAAIAAREVPIWVGWIVARRGRTARARNVAAREAYQKELAEHQATVSGRSAV